MSRARTVLKPAKIDLKEWAGGKQSPTLASYTDWRRIAAITELGKPVETKLTKAASEMKLEGLVLSPSCITGSPGDGWSYEETTPPQPGEARRPAERYHLEQNPTALSLTASQGQARVHLLGGSGHTAYHLRVNVPSKAREAELLLHLDTPGDGGLSLTLEFNIESNANLRLYTLSTVGGILYVRSRTSIGDGGRLEVHRLLLPAWGAAFHATSKLGSKAKLEAYSASIAHHDVWMDEDEEAIHLGDHSESLIRLRGTASGGSILSSRGRVTITKEAVWSSGDLEASLYEFEGSKAYSLPVLEVYTGDVMLGRHSALVTSIGGTEAFYLRQRGLRPEDLPPLYAVGIAEWTGVPEKLGLPLSVVEDMLRH